ncbi:enoyl-CoA hydratase/isomerase family protein [Aminobacter sp. LjRoot7]|uniref:enoyl-CoA hydratase/isomerase family protein n=1 Tax=Aminobacter sp. LjRoot7 TaxID=3342335 RepID=UPI003ECC3F49
MTKSFETITLTSDEKGQIIRLAFDTRTRGNVITPVLLEEFHAAIEDAVARKPRVLILSGTEKSFSRGADIDTIKSMGPDFQAYIASEFKLFDIVDRLPFITIAALTGIVIGNAAELALACDFRVATESSSFTLPEVAIGFVAPALRITRYLGIGAAKDFLLNAKMWKAEEARQNGVVSRVFADAEFEAGLAAFAQELADRPPMALAATKQGIATAYGYGPADYPGEEHWAYATYLTEDVKEGFAALAEKRKAVFTGK